MRKIFYYIFSLFIYNGYSQEVLWEKTSGGIYSDYLFDMSATLDNGFLLAGSSLSTKVANKNDFNEGNLDYFLWKMDSDGEHEWHVSFGGDGIDILKSITKTTDMGYLLGGYSTSGKSGVKTSENYGKNDLWLVKINAKGDLEWEKSYGGSGEDQLVKVLQLTNGEFLIVAVSNSEANEFKKSNSFGGLDYWVLKLDQTGKVIWENTYGGIYNDEPTTVLPTEEGFIIGGISNSPQSGNKTKDCMGGFDFWIIKLDNNGNLQNQFVFGGSSDEYLNDIIYLRETKNYILSGTTYSNSLDGSLTVQSKKGNDFLIIKTDLDFISTDQFVYDFGNSEYLTSTSLVNEKTLLLTGYTQDIKNNKKNFLAFKIDIDGEITWEKEISTSGDDVLRKSIVTKDGGIVLAGHSSGKNIEYKKTSYGRDDYWVVKLQSKENIKPKKIQLEAYPNPTEGWSEIVINHEYQSGDVNIFDLHGRLLHTEPLQYDMVAINLSHYPTGVYIVNIKTDVFNGSVKVIKK